jgi:hypothetical protein
MTSIRLYGLVPAHDEDNFEAINNNKNKNKNNKNDDRGWERAVASSGNFVIGTVFDDDDDDEHDVNDGWDMESSKRHPDGLSATFPSSPTVPSRRHPTTYVCPLTLQIMDDPVLDGCGHCFDRDAITAWLSFHSMCPISRKPLCTRDLIEAVALKERIASWKKEHEVDADSDVLQFSVRDSHSQFELMLLPQERKVLSLIKFRNQARTQRENCSRCAWAAVIALTLGCFTIAFAAIYVFNIEIRGPM